MPEITPLAFTSLVERAQNERQTEEAADLMALLDKVETEIEIFSNPTMAEALRMLELSTRAIAKANELANCKEYF